MPANRDDREMSHPGNLAKAALHPDDEEACQAIDSLIFSGSLHPDQADRLEYFLGRWQRGLREARAAGLIGTYGDLDDPHTEAPPAP